MEVLQEFLESSTIHGLAYISTSKVGGLKETISTKRVLQEDYQSYTEALLNLGLQILEDRRKSLSLSFANISLADGHFSDLLKKRK